MGNYSSTPEPSSFVNILTLRYDPSIESNLPKKTWKDFESIENHPICHLLKIQYVTVLNKN